MADSKKISELTTLAQGDVVAASDYLPIVDVSESSAASRNKKILVDALVKAVLAAPGAIGGTTPAAGSFTTGSYSGSFTANTFASSGATLTGGTINGMAIGGSTPAAGAFTTLSSSGNVTLGDAVGDSHTVNGTTAFVGTAGTIARIRAASSGDRFAIQAQAAGGGGGITILDNAEADYEPFELTAEYSATFARTGVGTRAEITRVTSTGLGVFCTPSFEFQVAKGSSGAAVSAVLENTSNTAGSHAMLRVKVPGSSAGDPYIHFLINAEEEFSVGIDNSDSNKFKISKANGLGTGDYLTIDTSGNVFVAKTATDNTVLGVELKATGAGWFTTSGNIPVIVNRKTDDGVLVSLMQDSAEEGTISVAGNTVSYNAFHGSHWSQLAGGERADILKGTVLETIDEFCEWPADKRENDRLPRVKVSDKAGSKRVYGCFLAWDEDEFRMVDVVKTGTVTVDGETISYEITVQERREGTNDMYVSALGAGWVRIDAAATVTGGDLLESAGNGCARVQSDDFIRASTIAKVSAAIKTDIFPDGSYLVPAVLMCG